jgi:hypothetical protein
MIRLHHIQVADLRQTKADYDYKNRAVDNKRHKAARILEFDPGRAT